MSLSKKDKAPKRPNWFSTVLQELADWINSKQESEDELLINKEEIRNEMTQLLSAKLANPSSVKSEVLYSEIGKKLSNSNHADIIIYNENNVDSVIEVRRFEAGKKIIDKDLQKLALVKNFDNKINCFLVLLSHQKAPFPFVTDSGVAARYALTISGTDNTYKVIRVCKASNSNEDDAYLTSSYALILEVI
jgi:hypothetical protein